MRHLRLVAVLALFAHRASAAAHSSNPLEGCRVTSVGPPTVHLACGQDTIDVTDTTPAERGEAFNEGAILGIKEGARQPVEQIEYSLELAGAKHRAVRLVSAGTLQWVQVALRRPEGWRTILCREAVRPASSCHGWIVAAAEWDWRAGPPANVRREIPTPELAGRPYRVPQGCAFVEIPGGGTVTCADHSILAWGEAAAAGTLTPEPLIANFRKLAKQERTIPCAVEGVPTTCWNGNDAGAHIAVHVSHPAVVRGKQLIVACLQSREGSGLPPACESVLSLP